MTITADGIRSTEARPRLSRREHLITVACSAWLIGGLFVDGWAHNNDKPESFFTPWHGLFYSGFTATALWMYSRYRRHEGVPVGYGLGFAGLGLFALGGMGDMVWHLVFGVEVDIEALLSPTHLLLFFSGVLVVSSPLRAAWSDPDDVVAPSLRQFFPALVSTTVLTATVAFFFMHFSPFITEAMHAEPYRFAASLPSGGGWLADELLLEGLAAILLTSLILLGTTLMLLRRWRVPAGSLTVLFTVTAALESSLWGFEMGETILAAGLAGLTADALTQRLQGTVSTPTVLRVVGFVVPVVLWLGYFAVLAVFYSVGWSVELWAGITVMSGLAGLGLAVLMSLPAPPSRVAPEGDHVL